jgi:hypothetical protein
MMSANSVWTLILRTGAVVAVLAVVSTSALAQRRGGIRDRGVDDAGEWQQVGSVQARFVADHDEIVLKAPNDDFRRIKFKVTDAALDIRQIVVTYDNGAPDKIAVRESIREGGESRPIDLRGIGRRSIRKIEFWYDTKGVRDGRANVTVFGMR